MGLSNLVGNERNNMPKYSVQKSFTFPYGHRLMKNKNLCKNIHGHNARLDVRISTDKLNADDMVIDFTDLKKIVKTLVDKLDHAFFVNKEDKRVLEAVYSIQEKDKMFITEKDPTSEYLCQWIYEEIAIQFIDPLSVENTKRLHVDFVRLWESDGSMAEYRHD